MDKLKNMPKIVLYIISAYLFSLYVLEYLSTSKVINLPYNNFLNWINGIFLLAGGFVIGIIYLRMKGAWNKIFGWFFILNNIVMFRFLLNALV